MTSSEKMMARNIIKNESCLKDYNIRIEELKSTGEGSAKVE